MRINSHKLLYMESYKTNQDILLLLAKRLKEYRLAARMSQKEIFFHPPKP